MGHGKLNTPPVVHGILGGMLFVSKFGDCSYIELARPVKVDYTDLHRTIRTLQTKVIILQSLGEMGINGDLVTAIRTSKQLLANARRGFWSTYASTIIKDTITLMRTGYRGYDMDVLFDMVRQCSHDYAHDSSNSMKEIDDLLLWFSQNNVSSLFVSDWVEKYPEDTLKFLRCINQNIS